MTAQTSVEATVHSVKTVAKMVTAIKVVKETGTKTATKVATGKPSRQMNLVDAGTVGVAARTVTTSLVVKSVSSRPMLSSTKVS
jgi:hypothetical protein